MKQTTALIVTPTDCVAEKNVKSGMLRAQLSVLLVKNVISYKTELVRVQRILLEKYSVEYVTPVIEEELLDMMYQEQRDFKANDVIEDEEDFFLGY